MIFTKTEGDNGLRAVEGIRFEQSNIIVSFIDGRELSAPLAWFPKLKNAAEKQLANWIITDKGTIIKWPDLDELISIDKLMA